MRQIKTFLADTKGSFVHLAAISMLPMAGALGFGVDYANAMRVKAELQSAADSTVLMLTREAPKKNQGDLQKLAAPYFAAIAAQKKDIAIAGIAVSKTDKEVSLTANVTLKTFFGPVYAYIAQAAGGAGINAWDINVATTAAYGKRKIELVLVLDNTGSMASANKINELKKASRTLLDMLEANATGPDQVKVSIVPYTTRVNLGKSHKDATWLTNQPTGTFMSGYNVSANRNAWQGCVADRDTSYNTAITPAGAVMQSRYPMVNCVDNLVEAMPLTSNFTQLRSRINAMNASGMTNITLGAQWGYEMLSANAPFTEHSPDPTVERFMILLTDGENTQDRWGSGNVSRMNKDTQAMCDAITERGKAEAAKTLKIKLYTVLVIAGNENLMRNCASNPSMYKKVNQASELEAVFKQIAEDIGQIRLTM